VEKFAIGTRGYLQCASLRRQKIQPERIVFRRGALSPTLLALFAL
jgi:hypothetical protein